MITISCDKTRTSRFVCLNVANSTHVDAGRAQFAWGQYADWLENSSNL